MLYFSGPLPSVYRAPNNFTNHLAYQGTYAYGNWWKSRSNHYFPSYEITVDQIPAFYKKLAQEQESHVIIEYPFDFADHSNLFYFYQIHHHKRVIAGYCSDDGRIRLTVSPQMGERMNQEQIGLAYTRPEFFLTGRHVKEKTHFRNMVDLSDADEISAIGADYLVLHKVMQSIYFKGDEMGNFSLFDESVSTFRELFTEKFHAPVFEDGLIVVFQLKKIAVF